MLLKLPKVYRRLMYGLPSDVTVSFIDAVSVCLLSHIAEINSSLNSLEPARKFNLGGLLFNSLNLLYIVYPFDLVLSKYLPLLKMC